ncbi:Retrovirus-related Pol polyprotein from transposon RE2 [Vitis vinifera]|uniref:Retrovirus-related Pol polyprotein from transposon RE2 n=1 Tax=Vitis vinifera TaxID=29760 RepID=A0A438IDE9_VITVI|nr:Retrovirus-related Pol polyprotein from transposon RE2 [Vitis vinifera]
MIDGELQEEVFVAQPQGFVHPRYPHYPSRANMSLFIYHTTSEVFILLVYVDDILVIGSSSPSRLNLAPQSVEVYYRPHQPHSHGELQTYTHTRAMELKSWIFCRYGSPTAINHPKTSPNIDKSTFKCTQCNKTDPTSMDIPQFQSNDSCNDNNRDQWKKDSKKTSTANVAEIKTETNVAEKTSALVAATDHGDHMNFDSRQVSPLRPSSQKIVSTTNGNTTPVIGEGSLTLTDTLNLDSVLVVPSLDYNLLSVSHITAALSCIVIFWPEFCVIKDIQTRQTIGCGFKRGKLYYLDLQSKDSNKLQQALMADGSEEEKKKSEIWLWHRRLGHASFAKTPISYWGEAITSAAYLINWVLSSSINFQTPLQALTNVVVAPTVPNLPPRVFGCVAFVHLYKHQRTKLTSHALQCVFVGYALHKKGYRCYHPPTRQMYITMDVVFHEDSMYFSFESELQGEYRKEIQTLDYDYHISEEDESGQSELVNQEVGELDMSGQQFGSEDVFTEIPNQSSSLEGVLNLEPDPFMKRLLHRHNRGIPKPTYEPELSTNVKYPMNNYVSNHRLSESNKSFVNQLSTVAIPNSVQQALADPRWKAAMNEEMKSLQKNESWELVECPPGKKPVGCRWIYTVKYKVDGSIERFKARLVAKGNTQTYGIDYTETFAPVAKINTVRVLLSLAANLDWPLQQFNVKNVFLHGELSEEVYMDLPPGCMVPKKQCQKVCKLKKSLYGLKQSREHGLEVTGNDPEERKALQNYLSREFEMKDLGPLKYFLGIEVSRSSEGIFLSQRKYALDLLQETGMSGCQPVNTPIEKNAPGKGILFAKNVDHQSIEVYTNADWAGAVDDRRSTSGYFTFVGGNLVTWKSKKQNVVARSSAEAEFRGMALGLCEALWLRLLLQDLGYLSRQPIRLFCDNKTACDIAHNPVQHDRTKHVEVDRFFIKEKLDDKIVELPKIRSEDQLANILTKAVSSQVFSKFLDKDIVMLIRHLVPMIIEAPAVTMSLSTQILSPSPPPNKAWSPRAVSNLNIEAHLVANPIFHSRSKHIELDLYFIRDKVLHQELHICYVPSSDQLVDLLTKHLPISQFCSLCSKLTVTNPPLSLRWGDNQTS